MREDLASGRLRVGPHPEALQRLAAASEIDFSGTEEAATPLHGDLNLGNLLILEAGPVFLDFEDTLHSVLPVSHELALVIERILLASPLDEADTVELGGAFLDAYRLAGGCWRPPEPDALHRVLRGLALRSLCVLALCEREGTEIVRDEWRKFHTFESLARDRRETLRRIVEG